MAGRFSITGVFGGRDNLSRVFSTIEGRAKIAFRGIESAAGRARSRLSAISGHTDKAVGAMTGAAKTAALAGGAALGAGFTLAIGKAAEFEQAMANVAAVSGATGAEFDALKKRAIELGSTTKFTGTEVAGAMESMTKAGFGTKEVLTGVSGLISAAAADGGELGDISNGLMATLKGFGAGADQLQPFADMMAKAGDSTAASIGSISEGMAKFGPVARQLGVSAASAFAQISLLQDAGMEAGASGTQLSAVYSKLVAPVGAAKKELAALGVEVRDSAGNMKAPERLFSEILKATDGIQGNAGKMAAFTNLVGLESKTAMLNIAAAAKSGKLGELTESLKNSAGYADQIAAKRMNTLFGDWKLFGGAVDGVGNSLYDMQGGALRGVVKETTDWLNSNRGLLVQKLDEWVGKARKAIEEAIPIVGWFTTGLVRGFRDVQGAGMVVVRTLGFITGGAAGLFGGGAIEQSYGFGRALVWLTAAIIGVSLASRVATVATYAWRAAVVLYRVAVWTATTVMGLYRAAANGYLLVTQGSTAATVKNTAVLWLNRGAQLARSVMTGIAAAAQVAYTAAVGAGTAALGPATVATWALVAPLVAAAAALGSLYALYLAFTDLLKQTGGWGGIGAGLDSLTSGGSFFGGVDEDLNRKAREEARLRAEKKKSGAVVPDGATKALGTATGAPAAKPTDVMSSPTGLFASLGTSLPGLGDGASDATKQLESLTGALSQFNTQLPAGLGALAADATPGGPTGAPLESGIAAPLDRYSSELAEMQKTLASTKDRLVIDINNNTGGAVVAQAPANGKVNVNNRAGVKVSDSGAM